MLAAAVATAIAIRMDLFQTIENFYQMMGVIPAIDNRSCLFNFKILLLFFSFTLHFSSTMGFLLVEAITVQEINNSMFQIVTIFSILSIFLTNIFKINTMTMLIRRFREISHQSE